MSHARRFLKAALLGAAVLLGTEMASAQTQTFYLDRAQISGAPDDGFMVWRPSMYEHTRFYGSLALGYTNRPLRASLVAPNDRAASQMDNPVSRQLITYLSVGSEIADRVGLNLSLPISLYQQGPGSSATANPYTLAVNAQAVHDLRLDTRVRVYDSANRRFRLGFGGAIWLPSGNTYSFAGDGSTTGYLYAAGEYDFGRFLIAGTLGPQFRPNRTVSSLNVGSELRWAFGGYMPFMAGRLRAGLELWGTTGVQNVNGQNTFFSGRNTDLEWLAQGRYAFGKKQRVYVNAGVGTRLSGGYGAPDFRILASIGAFFTISDTGAPSPPPRYSNIPNVSTYAKDTDHDGFPDDVDKCPLVPGPDEGCPRSGPPPKDTDHDGIPDSEDACPKVPGPANPDPKKNGCPQLTKVTESGEVELLKPIQFEFAKATIKRVSYPILNEVLVLMKARPHIRLGVYGNTDNKGAHALNMRLSKARAASCVRWLEQRGISPSRLESNGFGPDKPIATNATAAGRAKNRRVDFKILNE